MSKRIWKYVWKNKKGKKKIWGTFNASLGKLHKLDKYDYFKCGSSKYEQWSDKKYKEIPQEALDQGKDIFCRRCFSDLVLYPDMSLPDELFRL